MPTVNLNAVPYHIRGDVRRHSQEPLAEPFRTVGFQRNQDVRTASRFLFRTPIRGFGRRRITNPDDPRQVQQMWDSQVMTHYESQVGLPPLRVADTAEESGVIRGSAVFRGSLWALWFSGVDTPTYNIYARELTSATATAWGGGGAVDNLGSTLTQEGADLISHKDRLVALWINGDVSPNTSHKIAHSTNGITWTQATTQPTVNLLNTLVPGTALAFDYGRLVTVGNELVAVLYSELAGLIRFFSSTDSGATMVDEGSLIAVAGPNSSGGVKGAVEYIGIDGLRKLLVGTENGVYEVDTAPATWTANLIIPIRYHQDNCRRMTTHQGAVWIPIGANSGEPAGMIRYTVNGDTRLVETNVGVNGEALGLAAFDGVTSDKLGPFLWLKSVGQYLLAAVGGTAASRNGHLLIHNGLGWHYLARNETANQRLYWVDDINGTPHYANRTATGGTTSTTDTLGVRDALVNPVSGLAIARESSGLLDRPEFDGGMPRDPCAWLELFYDATSLGADTTGEYIALAYGLEGATPSTSLGNVLSGDKDLLFGTGGVGVSGVSIQIRETFNRDAGVNTDTPIGRALQITYLKEPPRLEAWAFEVDLLETAKLEQNGSVEAVIANLRTAEASVPLVAFLYGKESSRNVHVEPLQYEEAVDEEGPMAVPDREGFVTVVVREVVPA